MNFTNRFYRAAIISGGGIVGLFYLGHRWSGVAKSVQTEASHDHSPVDDNRVHLRSALANDTDGMKLKSVQVFFRHGARTPLKHIPGVPEVVYDRKFLIAPVPYTEVPIDVQYIHGGKKPDSKIQDSYSAVKFKGGVDAGMLTTIGKEQAYHLGKRLAERYSKFSIGKEFNRQDVFVRSTNINRCIESAQCVLAGMYGHLSFKAEDPVVIVVDKIDDEILFPSTHHCPSFHQLTKESHLSLQSDPEYIKLAHIIQKETGVKEDVSKIDMMQLRDHIVARRTHGLPVAEFMDDLYDAIDKAAVKYLVKIVCGNISENPTLGLSFGIGRLLNHIKENLKTLSADCTTTRNNNRTKLSLYSCHDSSIAPLLIAFGCYDDRWPPYTADISIELYEDRNGKHFVKVLYCSNEMVLRGYTRPLIKLSEFIKVINPFVLTGEQYKLHCNDVTKAVKHIAVFDDSTPDEKYECPPNI